MSNFPELNNVNYLNNSKDNTFPIFLIKRNHAGYWTSTWLALPSRPDWISLLGFSPSNSQLDTPSNIGILLSNIAFLSSFQHKVLLREVEKSDSC